jgi:DNA invertase Pin-like site-specific DNA recombinase
MGKTLGYARISTNDGQDVASQKAVLEQHGAIVVFTEIGNGSKLDGRDQLETAIRLLERGDTLLAINPDRLARDTGDLLTIGKRLVEKGAVLRIVEPAITFDGTDIMAEAMLTLFGMVGKIEKHFIKQRQRRGIDSAKAADAALRKTGQFKVDELTYRGRPATIQADQIKALKAEGIGASEIARRMKIGRASVYRVLEAAG